MFSGSPAPTSHRPKGSSALLSAGCCKNHQRVFKGQREQPDAEKTRLTRGMTESGYWNERVDKNWRIRVLCIATHTEDLIKQTQIWSGQQDRPAGPAFCTRKRITEIAAQTRAQTLAYA
jgi:hypothetical protein